MNGNRHFEALVRRHGDWFHCDGYSSFRKVDTGGLSLLEKRLVLSRAIYFLTRK
jgi:hypothetical protein